MSTNKTHAQAYKPVGLCQCAFIRGKKRLILSRNSCPAKTIPCPVKPGNAD